MTVRTALITGASRGIGREVARTLASEGWHVLSAVRVPKSAPPGTQAEAIDMADRESIEALAKRLRAQNQRLDTLVNKAGVYHGTARHIWDVNVLGPLLQTAALEPLLATNARVVMVTSSSGSFRPSLQAWSNAYQTLIYHSPSWNVWAREHRTVTVQARRRRTSTFRAREAPATQSKQYRIL